MLATTHPAQRVVRTIHAGRICYGDLKVGPSFDDTPAVTLTPGHAAWNSARFGDRL
jgi:hypothetical protein